MLAADKGRNGRNNERAEPAGRAADHRHDNRIHREHGDIAFEGNSPAELNNSDLIRQFYLGL
jgi:hypothetical protein